MRLERWQASLRGKQTHDALLAPADASAFLDLPASEIPPMDALDADEQDWTLSMAIEYAASMARESISVRRVTAHFTDRPPDVSGAYQTNTDAHPVQTDAKSAIFQPFYVVDKLLSKSTIATVIPLSVRRCLKAVN